MTDSPKRPFPGMQLYRGENTLPKNITFIVTEECNFRCTYCYLVHKNARHRMSFEVAKAAIDYVLEARELFPEPEVIWDFIGGEPLLEIDLIDQIIEYTKLRTYELDHPWFMRHNYSITTNGSLYHTDKVQRLIRENNSVGIGITIDGPKHVHDLARVYKNGSGTHADVLANIPLWLKQRPGNSGTKVTIAHENLPHLAEMILYVFGLGIKEVNANCVFEQVWHEGDDLILEQQLDKLADGMFAQNLWRTHNCTFFSRGIGQPQGMDDNGNWCGSGFMLAIDTMGNFYPCNRFLGFSLEKRKERMIGNIHDGIDINIMRPFLALTRTSQSSQECIDCEVSRGCAWCQGLNYDEADTSTIYQRVTYICEMHKARVRANKRFWERVVEAERKQG